MSKLSAVTALGCAFNFALFSASALGALPVTTGKYLSVDASLALAWMTAGMGWVTLWRIDP